MHFPQDPLLPSVKPDLTNLRKMGAARPSTGNGRGSSHLPRPAPSQPGESGEDSTIHTRKNFWSCCAWELRCVATSCVMPVKADIWMPLYIGDYLADTSDLTAEQSGCYLHWLMHYWRNGPLPDSIEGLTRIGRLFGPDASSIAQALLKRFFSQSGDGLWHQKRIDEELEGWKAKKQKAKEKAEKAAARRWKEDATSIPPSNASSTLQAMLEQCPSSSSSSTPSEKEPKQKQKPSRGKREVDPRHGEFRELLDRYWQTRNKGEMPWDGSEAGALGKLLAASPNMTAGEFRQLLVNRWKSEVNHGERPRVWIGNVTNYSAGPVDRFGKPMGAKNGNRAYTSKSDQAEANLRAALESLREDHGGLDGDGDLAGCDAGGEILEGHVEAPGGDAA